MNFENKNRNGVIKSSKIAFGVSAVILVMLLVPSIASAQIAPAFGPIGQVMAWFAQSTTIFAAFARGIAEFLMMFSSFVLLFSGMVFDWVMKFTIVDLARNIGSGTGVGGSITNAWATLRDIANMCFIFVLLFAAFKAMFQLSFSGLQTTIRNIVIIALLINFSLFFSKVVIDASNIVAVGFYNSITSSNPTQLQGSRYVIGSVSNFRGISGGYMHMLGMQTLYSADILNAPPGSPALTPTQILLIGFMNSIFMLITAVILLIAGIMFAARFIILVFLMILSPLALIAFAIPGGRGQFEKWKNALIDQSFFAPLYFALTWVVFRLGTALRTAGLQVDPDLGAQSQNLSTMFVNPGGSVALIVNYVLIIGFSIAALVFAKQMATRTAGFKIIAGGIGAAALGGAAVAGRNVIGRASSLISETQRDKWSKNAAGRAGLWLANKGSKASFDARGIADTKYGKKVGAGSVMGIAGKAGGVGGFAKIIDDKAKEKAKYAKDVYGQTSAEKELSDIREKTYEDLRKPETEKLKKERQEVLKREKERLEMAQDELERKKKFMEEKSIPADEFVKRQTEFQTARAKLKLVQESHRLVKERAEAEIEDKELSFGVQQAKKEFDVIKNTGKERQASYAERLGKGLYGTGWLGRFQPNRGYKEAARAVRKVAEGKEGKSKKEIKKMLEEAGVLEGDKGEEKGESKVEEKKEKPEGEDAPKTT